MIRFVDVRYQGLQARFAFFDTMPDRFIEAGPYSEQTFKDWKPPTESELGFREEKGGGLMSETKRIFVKNVEIETQKYDSGNVFGMAASVGEGQTMLRFAVSAPLLRCVKPPTYAPDEKTYVAQPADVPFREPESWEDDDDEPVRYSVDVDEGGFFYVKKGKMIKEGVYETVSERALLLPLLEQLMERLNAVYIAGKLLEEGIVEEPAEQLRIKDDKGQLLSILQWFGLESV